jgi:hypothetical protein
LKPILCHDGYWIPMKCWIQVVFGPYSYEDMVLQPGNPKRYFVVLVFWFNYYFYFLV